MKVTYKRSTYFRKADYIGQVKGKSKYKCATTTHSAGLDTVGNPTAHNYPTKADAHRALHTFRYAAYLQ